MLLNADADVNINVNNINLLYQIGLSDRWIAHPVPEHRTMSMQAIASAYGSSGSESDENPPSGVVSALHSQGKTKEKGEVQTHVIQDNRVRGGEAKTRFPESKCSGTRTSPPPPPPPPVALLGVTETPEKLLSRGNQGLSQPATKRRKVEERSEPLPARILLPRQVQTKIPNVSTEDVQSYGITSTTEREPR